ncbi:phage major capsid protein [Haloechinothrix salitolerans]|uniref:ATP-dependent Clp protease proteolytic subunit n=1 Tax=Haloechinothrix salitolerans TaxID=926830 RepID=A0ABW2BZK4_9PSEU
MSIKDLAALAQLGREYCRDHRDMRVPQNGVPWFRITNADGERAELFIYGAIGDDWDPDDVTAGDFTRRLRDITAPVIDLHINSPGGLVFDGIAIYNALRNHPARVEVTVDGVAASAASFVAMAGDDVAIEKPAKMMIHDAGGLTIGNAQDHQEMADLLNELSQTIAQVYADRAGGTADEWRDRMRAETWFSSAQAVATGLADRVVGEEPAASSHKKTPGAPAVVPAPRGKLHAAAWNLDNKKGNHRMNIEEILAAMKTIIDDAEGRTLTDEEVKRYEALESDLANKRTEAIRERQHAYESPAPTNMQAAAVHVAPAKQDDGLEKAFDHYLRTGKPNADIADLRVTNAQSAGTDTEGGFTVPEGFRQKLVDRLVAFGGLAQEAEEIVTETGNRLPWPTLDDTANSGVIADENTAPASGGADLVFGEKELNAFKYVAPGASNLPLRVSVELLQDSAFDIEGLVARKLGERIARQQATDWVTGTAGGAEPEGITNPTADHTFATGSTTTVTKDDLLDLLHTLDPDYRQGAKWLFNDNTLKVVRKLEDSNGRPLLQGVTEGLESMGGLTLLNHPVRIDQAVPDMAASAKSIVFGELRESYVIRRVRDIQLVVNPWTRANEGQVEYTAWARADGAIQNDNSFVIGANSAT